MDAAANRPKRKTRSDVARNRERLLIAAKAAFAQDGARATLDAVARKAGLGIGTLYRHFPTREALYEAVYRRDIEQLVALSDDLSAVADPVEGLRRWLHAAIDMMATKKGMIAAFALGADKTLPISARFNGTLTAELDRLLGRAVDSGRLGERMTAEELLLAVIGMCMLRDQPHWQASVMRLIDTLLDGMIQKGRAAPDG